MSQSTDDTKSQSSILRNEKFDEVHIITSSINKIDIDSDNLKGFELYEKGQDLYKGDEFDEEEKKSYSKVLRKVDTRLLPLLCVTYTLQFLDKLSLNYAAAYGLKEDLNLTGNRYSWCAAIFNFGYLFWAIPGNYLIQRFPVGKYTGFMLFSWSIILIGHVGLKNYGGALVIRFILGMFEASISPSCMALCGMFYTTKQSPLRQNIFLSFNGWATIIGALLSFGLGHAENSSLPSWKLIFLVIGLLNFVWSIIFTWLCPNSPETAKFLTEEEKIVLIKHIAKNNQGMKDHKFKIHQALEALKDLNVLMLAAIGLASGVINGGSSNFASTLIKGFGFNGITTSALQLPLGAIEVIFVLVAGIITFTIKNTRLYVLFGSCIAPLGGLIGLYVIPLEHKWNLVACAWFMYIIGVVVVSCFNLLTNNVAGTSKKTVSNGLFFLFYATGNIIGANIFYARQAPRYESGILGLLISYVGIMVLSILIRLLLMKRNNDRNKLAGQQTEEQAQQAILNGFKGMTDFENKGFRYAL
ncbi:uncharacterized protein KGF55_003256 [Candida pseudojiufengensis]|uniref:uncharacterized protein n=1 Tax=Candida pseudojiufengensis TaxID=497109 RepID=UPI002225AE73|nr:uncharacterized protein KGF55_003256 [Candida pseudojiufengensis]KAI5962180.1 hypothetical protein KGF55_003256 [Candida pseudojiufengensis]